MIRDACKKVGLEEKIGTHSMRKTFGYHWEWVNEKIVKVKERLNKKHFNNS